MITRALTVIDEMFDSDPLFVDDVDVSTDVMWQGWQRTNGHAVEISALS